MELAIRYSYDYHLRNIYSSNRDARKSGSRESLQNKDLVIADSDAMKKITAKLRDLDYSSDNALNILDNVKLFMETYNNLIDSTGSSDAENITKLKKQITNFTKENKTELEELGFSISASGKLSFDKTKFGSCSPSKIERFFGSDSEYMQTLRSYSIQTRRAARRVIDPMDLENESTKKKTASTESIPGANAGMNDAELLNSLLENPENGSSFDTRG